MTHRKLRILFTGPTSQAGRMFHSLLVKKGHEVVAVSRRDLADLPGEVCKADLNAPDVLNQLPKKHFHVLIHFASFVPLSEREST